MKYIFAIALLLLLSLGAYQFIDRRLPAQDSTEVETTVKDKEVIASEAEAVVPFDPTLEESNDYILQQISDLELNTEPDLSEVVKARDAFGQVESVRESLDDNRVVVTQRKSFDDLGPLERPTFDDTESEDDFIKRVSRQSGLSEEELREAFKGK